MMLSVEDYINNIIDKSYEGLVNEREDLLLKLKDIESYFKRLENNELVNIISMSPSITTQYLFYYKYLEEVNKLILEQFKIKYKNFDY